MKKMWHLVFCFFFLHLRVIGSSSFNSSSSPLAKLCSPEESFALLFFKSNFTIDSAASSHCSESISSFPKIDSWKKSSDCCSWDGVTCDRLTGHVIGLDLSSSWLHGSIDANSNLFRLRYLLRLNLACNNFNQSKIAANFGQLTKLRYLRLSSSNFFGQVPPEISHLSKLVSLDLSYNYVQIDQHSFDKLSQNLTELTHLILDCVNMSSVVPTSLMNLSSSLTSLTLRKSGLNGKFPTEVLHFPSLQDLILSSNLDLEGYLPNSNWSSPLRLLELNQTNFSGKLPNTIGNLIHLEILNLASCSFEGSIPASLGNLTSLTILHLGNNSFSGQVPATVSKLSKLTHLYLLFNNFSGLFPDVFGNLSKVTTISVRGNDFHGQLPTSAFNLTQLYFLDFAVNLFEGHFPIQVSGHPALQYLTLVYLNNNFLNGKIPSWLFSLPSLRILSLSNNKFKGPIDPFQEPGALSSVFLANNEIQGPIPNSMFELVHLIVLDLSSNNLSGIINSDKFSKLRSIIVVDLSRNSRLSIANGNVNFTLPILLLFNFFSCNLTEFPLFLGHSQNLAFLDLSNNRISGRISEREIKHLPSLHLLNLSHNFLTNFGKIPLISLENLDLRSNLLHGQLMVQAPYISLFLISNNKLTGEIPSSICDLSYLTVLDLSNNNLSGRIPDCLTQGAYETLTTLQINDNQLEGPLPSSLVICHRLGVLDVGNNMINDTFPNWSALLPKLKVLILRSNRFYGPIGDSKTRYSFPELKVLDISRNGFTGILPTRLFESFEAMMQGDKINAEVGYIRDYYYFSVDLTIKGRDIEMNLILKSFTSIDFSSNQFEGQIPEVVGKLNSLIVLNFSSNNLTGYIPSSLQNLTNLESLDLSSNKLSGKIPVQLMSLTFLSVLNLSYNQLVGPIPQGNQFNTFENNSYIGNLGLCGSPLTEKCSNDEAPEPTPTMLDEEHDNSSWFDWKIIIMGYGSGLVIGFSMGYMVFSTRKPQWFVRIVERGQLKIMTRLKYGR